MKTLLYAALLLAAQLLTMENVEASPTRNLLMRKNLNHGWQFRQVGKDQWHPASVPGTVNTDLLKKKLINDPFYGDEATTFLTVTSRNLVKNLFLDSKYDLDLSQNFFDVTPGTSVKVRIGSKTKIMLKDIITKSMYDCMTR